MDELTGLQETSAGLAIIGNLTDDGYLMPGEDGGDPILSVALEAGVLAAVAQKILRRIQQYDPPGCGSRDLQECLVIQANAWIQKAKGDPSEADGDLVLARFSSRISRRWRLRIIRPSFAI